MNHRAKKRLGQNFLVDQNIIDKIINSINPKNNDRLIEIGPGLGAITHHLLERTGTLDVIELDRDVIPKLQSSCEKHGELHIHNIDVLKFDFSEFCKTSNNNNSVRVAGNLPYNISTPILFHLLKHKEYIIDLHFMLQKEVVERIVASPSTKQYGRLSVMIQTYWHATPLFTVSAQCFSPSPKVESAIIRLIPRKEADSEIKNMACYENLVRNAFSQRRKTLKNNLKKVLSAERIIAAGVDPTVRAETLNVQDFIRLHELLL